MGDETDAQLATGISRRGILEAGAVAVVGGTVMPLSQAVRAAKGRVLRARAYADIDKLNPGFYQNACNVDVMDCIYTKPTEYVPGRKWDWRLQAAESIEQVDGTHIRFKLRKGIMFTGGYGISRPST